MPTESDDEPILVGVIARAHGLRGEVVVDSTTDAPDRFAPGSVLTATLPSGEARTVRIVESRPFGERLLVRLEGVTTRTDAEALRGTDLTVRRRDVRPLPEGSHYRFELIGLEARTAGGEPLGEVVDIFSTGGNDVFVLRGPRGEILLPALPEVILAVDVQAGTLTVAPPPGLPGWDEG